MADDEENVMDDQEFLSALEALKENEDQDVAELLKMMNENRIISWEEAEQILGDTGDRIVKSSLPEQTRPTEPDNDTDVDRCIQQLNENDPKLKHVNLNNMKRTPIPQIKRLVEAVAYNTELESLSLANLGLYDTHVESLPAVLELNTTLKKLNLETNYLSGDFFSKLFKAAQVNQTLEEVKAVNQGVSFATTSEKEIIDSIVGNRGLIKVSVNLRLPEGRHKIENSTLRNGEIKRVLRREEAARAKAEAAEAARKEAEKPKEKPMPKAPVKPAAAPLKKAEPPKPVLPPKKKEEEDTRKPLPVTVRTPSQMSSFQREIAEPTKDKTKAIAERLAAKKAADEQDKAKARPVLPKTKVETKEDELPTITVKKPPVVGKKAADVKEEAPKGALPSTIKKPVGAKKEEEEKKVEEKPVLKKTPVAKKTEEEAKAPSTLLKKTPVKKTEEEAKAPATLLKKTPLKKAEEEESKAPATLLKKTPVKKAEEENKVEEKPELKKTPLVKKLEEESKAPTALLKKTPLKKPEDEPKAPTTLLKKAPLKKAEEESKPAAVELKKTPVKKTEEETKAPSVLLKKTPVKKTDDDSKTPVPTINKTPAKKTEEAPDTALKKAPAKKTEEESKTPVKKALNGDAKEPVKDEKPSTAKDSKEEKPSASEAGENGEEKPKPKKRIVKKALPKAQVDPAVAEASTTRDEDYLRTRPRRRPSEIAKA